MRRAFAIALVFTLRAEADWPASELWYKCKGCHGGDGKANTKVGADQKVADFTNPRWQASRDDGTIRDIIANGSRKKDSKMKAYKGHFSDTEIDSLVPYIRAFRGK